jgi:outer membrane protein
MLKELFCSAVVAATLATPVRSQTPSQSQTAQRITLDDAIKIALDQNLILRQAENNYEVQQAVARQAKMNLLPSFSFNANASDNVGQQFNQNLGKLTTQATQSLSPGIGSTITLFDGTRTYANISSANHTATALGFDVTRARQTAVYTAITNFIGFVSAQSQLTVQQQNLAAVEAQLQVVETKEALGDAPKTDVYNQRALVANARLTLAQADQNVESTRIDLMQALQLDPTQNYEFVAPVIPDSIVVAPINVDSLVRLAQSQRADVAAARDRVLAAGQDVKVARAGRWPTITLGGNYATAYTSAGDSGVLSQFNQRRGGGASLGISLPVLDRGNTHLNEQRAEVAEENAQLALVNQQRSAAFDVRRAAATLHSAQEQLAAAAAQESSASLALDGAQERYRVGEDKLLDVTQARSQLVSAQMALVTARYNLVLMQRALDYFSGALDAKK